MNTKLSGPRQLIGPLPDNETLRFFLAVFRRMGANGINDAIVGNAIKRRFGQHYRQPYLLIQALMVDLSRYCRLTITIAPFCCRQMTTDEAQMIAVFNASESDPARAMLLLSDLTGNRECHGVLATINAVRAAITPFGLAL